MLDTGTKRVTAETRPGQRKRKRAPLLEELRRVRGLNEPFRRWRKVGGPERVGFASPVETELLSGNLTSLIPAGMMTKTRAPEIQGNIYLI